MSVGSGEDQGEDDVVYVGVWQSLSGDVLCEWRGGFVGQVGEGHGRVDGREVEGWSQSGLVLQLCGWQ